MIKKDVVSAKMDIVYNYVNSNDQEWIERRNEYDINNSMAECRYRDNDELKFSLRSLEKYAPWIENIYIVTDSKLPDWLNTSNNKIHVVDHKDIMPEELLPCYNSNVIEAFIPYIKGLSDIFLYSNDDMIFGNHVAENFFVQNGKPVVRMIESSPANNQSYYLGLLLRTNKIFEKKYGANINLKPWHNIDVYDKKSMIRCLEAFYEEFSEANRNRFRADNDIQRVIFQYYMIKHDECYLVKYNMRDEFSKCIHYIKQLICPSKYSDFLFTTVELFVNCKWRNIILKNNPRVFCINDSEGTMPQMINEFKKIMENKFPEKSEFEI